MLRYIFAGQHDDARMNISMAISAARMGGTMTNYTEVVKLYKDKDATGKEVVCGARVKDRQTGTVLSAYQPRIQKSDVNGKQKLIIRIL